jgi:NADH-quinone oxidoreductase subunit L
MGGLKKYLPITYITFLLGVLAISGIPPFSGFFSKDEILAQTFAVDPIIWAGGLITSLLTALYMFRLFFLTFFGTARASEEKMTHIHESPMSMSIPLMILGALSLLGGFIGVPEILGGSHALKEFLAPVFVVAQSLQHTHHLDHNTEFMLMGIVITLTLIVILFAFIRYVKKETIPAADGTALSSLEKLLQNKYYIDELYHAVFVKPLYALSKWTDSTIERLGIDGAVNGIGSLVIWSGRAARFVQRGTIGYYIFVMVLGIASILIINYLKH